ncbi:amidohydrolase family protein [Hyphococcus aureus]|uniref:Amidohydrolase family protein n=2 Tax=Hyphococcus aureus TaxID=2666033 RepID=A0ABW1L0M6_9PROT
MARTLDFEVDEGTWVALDVSPDGGTILFDLLGDIYALNIDGGKARPVLQGPAFETHPVFSPDGKQFAFISDRSGSSNLWIANVDGSGLKQLSHDKGVTLFTSPTWSADGEAVFVSRAVHYVLAFELYKFSVNGGEGERITNAKPSGHETFDARHNALGAIASPDGHYIYYATKHGSTWTDEDPPNWAIARRDLKTGVEDLIVAAVGGGGMKPALSHDGRFLAYASRYGEQTGLRLRDLETGEDRSLAFPVGHDGQVGGYYADLFPRFAFTPDDRNIVFNKDGKFHRISIESGAVSGIPFSAHVELGLGPITRVPQKDDAGPVRVRVIEETKLSPDGESIVFSALGAIYLQELKEGAHPRNISAPETFAFQPSWSPDGSRIAYVTWSANEKGHVWSVAAEGGAPQRLTQSAAFYSDPVFSPKGDLIVAMRANHYERLRKIYEISPERPTDIIRLPAGGGEASLIVHAFGARLPQVSPDGTRVRYYTPEGAKSVRLDGKDMKTRAKVIVPNWNQYFADQPATVDDLKLNPHGDQALVKTGSQLYLVLLPPPGAGEAPTIDLTKPNLIVKKLTDIGADFFGWSADGKKVFWTIGATYREIAVNAIASLKPGEAEDKAKSVAIYLELPRDKPDGAILLRGATAITMKDDEVIRNADILVVENRVAAIGKRGKLDVPKDVTIRNVRGKYILPGFVDTHAHWVEVRRKLQEPGHWNFLVNLAYGVTSGLDVQPFTVDVFAYQDMIDAGLMIGPRAYSTGPGVFVNSRMDTKENAIDVLTRYRDYYRTRNIKSYMVGGREQRQHMIEAAAELGMMPTTEGASDLWLNLTHAIDGFSGDEHTLPVTPLYGDVVELYAKSRIAYTPTLLVGYGGPPAWDEMVISDYDHFDDKLRRFMPEHIITDKLRNIHWRPPEDQTYPLFAADALKILRAGGLVGVGSHGNMQGLGYHWEMQALAAGGATPHEVLKAATIGSSEVIGRALEIGSLEPGKFADLLILDENPLEDIRNTMSLEFVMKNGRLYDAETLDEVWPRQRPLGKSWFQDEGPVASSALTDG